MRQGAGKSLVSRKGLWELKGWLLLVSGERATQETSPVPEELPTRGFAVTRCRVLGELAAVGLRARFLPFGSPPMPLIGSPSEGGPVCTGSSDPLPRDSGLVGGRPAEKPAREGLRKKGTEASRSRHLWGHLPHTRPPRLHSNPQLFRLRGQAPVRPLPPAASASERKEPPTPVACLRDWGPLSELSLLS